MAAAQDMRREPPGEHGARALAARGDGGASVERFGRYELRHLLASGGMASVHLAVTAGSAGFQKVLAVKRMHPHLAHQPAFVEMFLDEARIASHVDHPNVCAVLDFGDVGGEHFMAMELLIGEPYGKLLARLFKRPAEERMRARRLLAHLLADACEGAHAAHELRSPEGEPLHVVHRDISPHNLVVTYNGVIKVVDFGVARAAQRFHQTTTGTVKGKFGYMAPEQMRGQPVDRRADVWSLGVVLWESLAGCSLFRRATQSETVLAVMNGRVPSLTALDPSIDPALDAIARRALAMDPADRYPTARAMGRALRAWAAQHGGLADAGELAAWMRHLFPGGLEARQQLVRRALARPLPGAPAPAVAGGDPPPSHSTVVGRQPSSPDAARARNRGSLVWPLLGAAVLGAAAAFVLTTV
ncbi:MAG: serine/threonine-protein kinase, partial [Myxococcota bacterium]